MRLFRLLDHRFLLGSSLQLLLKLLVQIVWKQQIGEWCGLLSPNERRRYQPRQAHDNNSSRASRGQVVQAGRTSHRVITYTRAACWNRDSSLDVSNVELIRNSLKGGPVKSWSIARCLARQFGRSSRRLSQLHTSRLAPQPCPPSTPRAENSWSSSGAPTAATASESPGLPGCCSGRRCPGRRLGRWRRGRGSRGGRRRRRGHRWRQNWCGRGQGPCKTPSHRHSGPRMLGLPRPAARL